MTEIITKQYRCDYCGRIYGIKSDAEECEARPLTMEKGAKVGEIVAVTGGQAARQTATVTSRFVCGPDGGRKYWHTVGVSVLLPNGDATDLLFDQYATTKPL